jgi:preprotein translocase subunit Sss1
MAQEPAWLVRTALVLFFVGFAGYLGHLVRSLA